MPGGDSDATQRVVPLMLTAHHLPFKVVLVLLCVYVVIICEDFAERAVVPWPRHGIRLSGFTPVEGVAMDTAGAVWNPR
eukprot:1252603-Amphidinium_carterae.1